MDCPTTSAAVKPDFQVMSAQAGASADAPLQNGVDAGTSRVREEEAETGARGSGPVLSTGSEPGQEASRGGGQSGEGADMAQAWPAAPTWNGEDDRSREGCVDDRAPGVVEQGPETRADITGQAGTSGGGPAVQDSGMLGGAPLSNPRDGASVGDYHTPRSSRSFGPGGSFVRPAMQTQLPSWVTRLGEFFKAPAVQWLPSPIPSPPRPRLLNMNVADQHGDMTGMSRSGAVGNAREDGFRVNSYPAPPQQQTPSSSSIPAEAIQAEVQRQLGGLLDRLQVAEQENARLQEQLAQTQRDPHSRGVREVAGVRDPSVEPQRPLQPQAPLQPQEPQEHPQPREPQELPQCQVGDVNEPRGYPGHPPDPRPDPWRDPLGALWEELQSRRAQSTGSRTAVPKSLGVLPGGEGLQGRSSEDTATTATLEALTKNLTSLQELQTKSLRREMEGDYSPEQVKTSAVNLPSLHGPE